MKASEVINELRALKEKYGDKNVVIVVVGNGSDTGGIARGIFYESDEFVYSPTRKNKECFEIMNVKKNPFEGK